MSAVKTVNPNADTMGKGAALHMNINAAKGMYDVLKTNLGALPSPRCLPHPTCCGARVGGCVAITP
jgi:hypothetical protein